MTESEHMARAEAARRLLDDPLLQEAFKTLEETCTATWKASPARDQEGREWLWMLLQATQNLKGHFDALIATGKIAAENLKIADQHRRFVDRNYSAEDQNA